MFGPWSFGCSGVLVFGRSGVLVFGRSGIQCFDFNSLVDLVELIVRAR